MILELRDKIDEKRGNHSSSKTYIINPGKIKRHPGFHTAPYFCDACINELRNVENG